MDSIANIGTFIKYLTYYIKTTIYINKGTDNDKLLERCIKLYNKYKTIEASSEISDEDESFVRKCLKRLNLILKVDEKNKPVDVRNKENQTKIIYLQGHYSLDDDNLAEMIKYATKYNINILTDVPLMFVIRESKYRDLLWQYTRGLFYISQLLLCSTANETPNTEIYKQKTAVFDHAALKLENILLNIADIEEKMELDKIMTVDKFLNNKLIKTGINEKNISEARQEVKNMFNKKGLGNDNTLMKMVDSISSQLQDGNISNGNIVQNMFGIAKSVAQEMRGELEGDPEKFQNTLGAITDVFKTAMNDDSNTGNIPAEVKNMFNSIVDVKNLNEAEPNSSEIMKGLESLVENNGLDREEFFTNIRGENGQIDVNKLESFLHNKK